MATQILVENSEFTVKREGSGILSDIGSVYPTISGQPTQDQYRNVLGQMYTASKKLKDAQKKVGFYEAVVGYKDSASSSSETANSHQALNDMAKKIRQTGNYRHLINYRMKKMREEGASESEVKDKENELREKLKSKLRNLSEIFKDLKGPDIKQENLYRISDIINASKSWVPHYSETSQVYSNSKSYMEISERELGRALDTHESIVTSAGAFLGVENPVARPAYVKSVATRKMKKAEPSMHGRSESIKVSEDGLKEVGSLRRIQKMEVLEDGVTVISL